MRQSFFFLLKLSIIVVEQPEVPLRILDNTDVILKLIKLPSKLCHFLQVFLFQLPMFNLPATVFRQSCSVFLNTDLHNLQLDNFLLFFVLNGYMYAIEEEETVEVMANEGVK